MLVGRRVFWYDLGVPVVPPDTRTIECMIPHRRGVNRRGGRCACRGRHRLLALRPVDWDEMNEMK